ncbi:MAG: hypothetical protein P8R54_09230 [Myxococcota bacterium]|nr:hypothetical protein [Myxococcota bacterium]
MTAEDAIQALTECLSKGMTGCLSSRSDGAYRIYVTKGELLAAHGPDDGIWVVRRLVNNGAITDSQGRQVTFYLGQGYRLEELLLDQVPDQLFLDILVERFRQNILDFSFISGPMMFEEMEAIFVDNIQVGHDSHRMLSEILNLRTRIIPLRQQISTLALKPGTNQPSSRQEARLFSLCASGIKLDALLAVSPYEDGQSLTLIQNMLNSSILLDQNGSRSPTAQPLTSHAPGPHSPSLSEAITVTDELMTHRASPPPSAAQSAAAQSAAEPTAEPTAAQPPTTPRENHSGMDSFRLGFSSDPFSSDPFTEEDDLDASGDPFSQNTTLDDAIQRAQEQEERRQAARKSTMHDDDGFATTPISDRARKAMAYDEEVDADEMAMFEDYDVRRGDGKGQFSVERTLLDRVDLGRPLVESKPPIDDTDDGLLEMGDTSDMTEGERASAFSLSFGPPPLRLIEQRHKVSVCNDVLTELSQSIDVAKGPGSGRACVQLLIDGTPHQFAVLFMNVESDSSGGLDPNRILKNLNRRPESEHRRLLNMGLLNLIERALSSGMEELEDDAIDQMLQRVAGYQMRLGL